MIANAAAPPSLELALSAAAARATLAPSIHNTQPWRFVVHPDRLELWADPSRQLAILDPDGRELAISCGAALFGARVALAADQFDAVTSELPDPRRPDLLATLAIEGTAVEADEVAHRLNACAGLRHTNRRRFAPDPVDAGIIDALDDSARIERAWLHEVVGDDRVTLAVLSQHADSLQNADPAYRTELRAWTGGGRDRADGVPASAIPADGAHSAHDDIPIRDFDSYGVAELPAETHSRLTQTLLVLGTDGDEQRDWLVAGQALARILLELTDAGLVASIFSQVIEEPGTRAQLRNMLLTTGHPQLLLRVGHAERTGATPRRPLADVMSRAV